MSLLKKLTLKEKKTQRHVLNPKENWIVRYVEISSHISFRDFDQSWFENIHLDIIRDLLNDSLDNDIHLHLLSLIELFFPLFDNDERVEETFILLLKLIKEKANIRKNAISRKYYQCTTSMMLYFQNLISENQNVLQLYKEFFDMLISHTNNQLSSHYDTCLDCLQEIATCCPRMFQIVQSYDLTTKPRNLGETHLKLLILDFTNETEKIRDIVQQLTYVPDIKFYHIYIYLYRLILSKKNTNTFSQLILRPFLSKFIMSNQIHHIHFALKLLIEFGFDIFTSREEELFLRQMVRACTIPSLPVGHRLLLLAFIKIAFESLYKPPLNSPPLSLLNNLHPIMFDGSDTLEKKLQILNQSTFVITDDEFFSILIDFQRKSSLDLRNYERATNSFFHLISQCLMKRTQLMERISQLLLDSFFNPQYIHYVRKFCLFWNDHKEIGQKITDNFIAKLMVMTKDQDNSNLKNLPATISSYKAYAVYLNFINWFLSVAHRNIRLTEFQLEFLINFIYRNSFHHTESSSLALQCCTSILYYQRVTQKVKGALMTLLEWLRNERKSDLEASSLAQIYLLALRTLTEESIKQVFTSDEEEFLMYQSPEMFEQYMSNVRNTSKECPVIVESICSEKMSIEKQIYGSLLSKTFLFHVSLDPESKFDRVFCVEIKFLSNTKDDFNRVFQIPFIEIKQKPLELILTLNFLITKAFHMNISVKFVDFKGNIYNYIQNKNVTITFEDLLIPVEPYKAQINSKEVLEIIKEDTLKHSESLETVICVREFNSFHSFIEKYRWMEKFILDDYDSEGKTADFLIGLAPDRIIFGSIKLVNGFINIWLVTNCYDIIPPFFSKFHHKNYLSKITS